MNYANIDSRIKTYSKEGFAGNIELVGLSSFTGRAIDVYEPAAGGSVTVTSHVAPGASEHYRIRLWRDMDHYQSITFCPPPPPRATNPLPSATPTHAPTARAAPANRPAPARRPSVKRAASADTLQASPGDPAALTKKASKEEWLDSIIKQFTAYGNESLLLTRRNMALVIFNSSFARIKATDPGTDSDSENTDEPELPDRLPPSANTLLSNSIKAANRELAIAQVGRAKAKLLSSGILTVDDALLEKLRLKYPPKSTTAEDPPDPEPDPLYDPDPNEDVVSISSDSITKLINTKSKYTGAGWDGWSFALLKEIMHKALKRHAVYTAVSRGLAVLINDIANARLDTPELRLSQTTLRGIPLRKGDSDDVRPIGIGQLFVTIAGTLAVRSKAVQKLIPAAVGPTELMHGVHGGIESLVHIIRAYLFLHPDHVAVKTDVSNAFNTLDRRWVLRAATCYPPLEPLAKLLYGQPTRVLYSDCTEKDSTKHEIIAETGTTQGEPLAALLFSTSLKIAVDHVLRQFPAVSCRGIADDRIFMGPIDDVIQAIKVYEMVIAHQGLKLSLPKTKLYKRGSHGGVASVADACKAIGIVPVTGFLAGGAPVGDAEFIQDELRGFFDGIADVCDKIRQLYLSNKHTGNSKQDIYRIIRWCVSPSMTNHMLRALAPDVIRQHVARFDMAVYRLTLTLLDTNDDDELCSLLNADGLLTHDIVRLRASMGGLSICSAAKTAHQAYLGSLCLVFPLIKAALGDSFDTAAATNLFPDLARAFSDGSLTAIKAFEGVTIDTLMGKAVDKAQRVLGGVGARKLAADVLERIVDPKDKAWFLSGREHGATWLSAYAGYGQSKLTDNQWSTLVRSRLNLVVVKGFDGTDTACPNCADSATALSEPARRLQRNGTHALTCQQTGQGGARGQRTTRAQYMRGTLIAALKTVARKSDLGSDYLGDREPAVTDFYPAKPDVDITAKNRADFAVFMKGATYLADAVLTHPNPASHPTSVKKSGAAAAAASTKKLTSYNNLFDIPVGRLVPFSYETGGFVDPDTLNFIRTFVKYGMAEGDETEPEWTPYNRAEYQRRCRSVCESISISIARSVANTLITGSVALSSRRLATAAPRP